MRQDWICSSCSQSNAVIFCQCTSGPTFLCERCKSDHLDKKSEVIHQLIPIKAFGPHRDPGFLQKAQERCRAVDAAERHLQSEVARIDACIDDFNREMQTFSQKLEAFKHKIIATLKKFKQDCEAEVTQSIRETRNSIYEESPVLRSVLSEYVRNFNAAAPIALFQFRTCLLDDVTEVAKLSFVTAVLSSDQSANRLCDKCRTLNNPLNEKCFACKAARLRTGEATSRAGSHETAGSRHDHPMQERAEMKRAESWPHPSALASTSTWNNTAAPWHCVCGSHNSDHLQKCLHCSRPKPKFRCQECKAFTEKSDCVCVDCTAKKTALRSKEKVETSVREQEACELF